MNLTLTANIDQERFAGCLTALELSQLRRQRGMTQVELAARLGWSQSQVSRFEHTADHQISTVAAYVAALGGALTIGAAFVSDNSYVRIAL